MRDVIVLGGGISGLTAAIYAARYNLKTLVIAKRLGGNIMDSSIVENYPGYKSISGIDLMDNVTEQVKALNVEIKEEEVVDINKNKIFKVKTKNKKYEAKSIILATGGERRKLDIPGEKKLTGKGVFSCATCDAPLFKDKTVAIIGGSYNAVKSALLLTEYAKKIYVIYRRDRLRGEPIENVKVMKSDKVEILFKTNVKEFKGDKKLESVILDNGKELKLGGVFVEVGFVMNKELAEKLGVKTDDEDHIIVDQEQKTNIKGIFACGDVTTNSNKMMQLVTAAGEAAVAAESAYRYLNK